MNRDQIELYEVAKRGRDSIFGKQTSAQTYYKLYQETKHLKEPFMEYRSEEYSDLRSALDMLWPAEDACKECAKIILAAYVRFKMEENTMVVPELDLFNYMM